MVFAGRSAFAYVYEDDRSLLEQKNSQNDKFGGNSGTVLGELRNWSKEDMDIKE